MHEVILEDPRARLARRRGDTASALQQQRLDDVESLVVGDIEWLEAAGTGADLGESRAP